MQDPTQDESLTDRSGANSERLLSSVRDRSRGFDALDDEIVNDSSNSPISSTRALLYAAAGMDFEDQVVVQEEQGEKKLDEEEQCPTSTPHPPRTVFLGSSSSEDSMSDYSMPSTAGSRRPSMKKKNKKNKKKKKKKKERRPSIGGRNVTKLEKKESNENDDRVKHELHGSAYFHRDYEKEDEDAKEDETIELNNNVRIRKIYVHSSDSSDYDQLLDEAQKKKRRKKRRKAAKKAIRRASMISSMTKSSKGSQDDSSTTRSILSSNSSKSSKGRKHRTRQASMDEDDFLAWFTRNKAKIDAAEQSDAAHRNRRVRNRRLNNQLSRMDRYQELSNTDGDDELHDNILTTTNDKNNEGNNNTSNLATTSEENINSGGSNEYTDGVLAESVRPTLDISAPPTGFQPASPVSDAHSVEDTSRWSTLHTPSTIAADDERHYPNHRGSLISILSQATSRGSSFSVAPEHLDLLEHTNEDRSMIEMTQFASSDNNENKRNEQKKKAHQLLLGDMDDDLDLEVFNRHDTFAFHYDRHDDLPSYICLPASVFRRVWAVVRLLALLYFIMMIPFRLGCFKDISVWHSSLFLDWFLDVFFIVDIPLKMFAFTHKDPETQRYQKSKDILSSYLGWELVLDVAATLPYSILGVLTENWAQVQKTRLSRLLRVFYLFHYISRVGNAYVTIRNHNLTYILKLFVVELVLGHFVACGLVYIANHSTNDVGRNWMNWISDNADQSPFESYSHAVYFTFTTMYNVGYGDIAPESMFEIFICVCLMTFGYMFHSLIIGHLVPLLKSRTAARYEFQQKVDILRDIIQSKNLDESISQRVVQYREYIWNRQMGVDEEELLSLLPYRYRVQVVSFLCGHILADVAFLRGSSKGFIRGLCGILTAEIYSPGDTILSRGHMGAKMCFIVRGEAEQLDVDEETVLDLFIEGDCVGDDVFLAATAPVANTVRANVYVNVFELDYGSFDEVLSYFKKESREIQAVIQSLNRDITEVDPQSPIHGMSARQSLLAQSNRKSIRTQRTQRQSTILSLPGRKKASTMAQSPTAFLTAKNNSGSRRGSASINLLPTPHHIRPKLSGRHRRGSVLGGARAARMQRSSIIDTLRRKSIPDEATDDIDQVLDQALEEVETVLTDNKRNEEEINPFARFKGAGRRTTLQRMQARHQRKAKMKMKERKQNKFDEFLKVPGEGGRSESSADDEGSDIDIISPIGSSHIPSVSSSPAASVSLAAATPFLPPIHEDSTGQVTGEEGKEGAPPPPPPPPPPPALPGVKSDKRSTRRKDNPLNDNLSHMVVEPLRDPAPSPREITEHKRRITADMPSLLAAATPEQLSILRKHNKDLKHPSNPSTAKSHESNKSNSLLKPVAEENEAGNRGVAGLVADEREEVGQERSLDPANSGLSFSGGRNQNAAVDEATPLNVDLKSKAHRRNRSSVNLRDLADRHKRRSSLNNIHKLLNMNEVEEMVNGGAVVGAENFGDVDNDDMKDTDVADHQNRQILLDAELVLSKIAPESTSTTSSGRHQRSGSKSIYHSSRTSPRDSARQRRKLGQTHKRRGSVNLEAVNEKLRDVLEQAPTVEEQEQVWQQNRDAYAQFSHAVRKASLHTSEVKPSDVLKQGDAFAGHDSKEENKTSPHENSQETASIEGIDGEVRPQPAPSTIAAEKGTLQNLRQHRSSSVTDTAEAQNNNARNSSTERKGDKKTLSSPSSHEESDTARGEGSSRQANLRVDVSPSLSAVTRPRMNGRSRRKQTVTNPMEKGSNADKIRRKFTTFMLHHQANTEGGGLLAVEYKSQPEKWIEMISESFLGHSVWFILCIFCILYFAFMIPYKAALYNDHDLELSVWVFLGIEWIVDVLFVLDFVMRLRYLRLSTDDEDEEEEERSSKLDQLDSMLFEHMCSANGITLDVLSLLPFELVLLTKTLSFSELNLGELYVLRLNRLLRLRHLNLLFALLKRKCHDSSLEWVNSLESYLATLDSAAVIFVCAHLAACIWFGIAALEEDQFDSRSWVTLDDSAEGSLLYQYMRSIFWILITTFTVGYGGIVPISLIERGFVIMFLVMSTVIFAYVIAELTARSENSSHTAAEWERKLELIKTFQANRNIPPALVNRLSAYFRFLWSQQKGQKDEFLMSQIPEHTRIALISALVRTSMRTVPVMRGVETGFLDLCCLVMTFRTFSPQDTIVAVGEISNEVFFVYNGDVSIFNRELTEVKEVVSAGAVIGETNLMEQAPMKQTYIATTFVQTVVLTKSDFDWAVSRYPKVKSKLDHDAELLFARRQWFVMTVDEDEAADVLDEVKAQSASLDAAQVYANKMKKRELLKRLAEAGKQLILQPAHVFRSLWSFLSIMFLAYLAVMVPFRVAFRLNDDTPHWSIFWLDPLADLFFLIDIYMRFRHFARYSAAGVLETNRGRIQQDYLRAEFYVDLFGSLPLDVCILFIPGLSSDQAIPILYISRSSRLLHLHRVYQYFSNIQDFIRQKLPSVPTIYVSLARQGLQVATFIHWAACGWYYISTDGENAMDADNWTGTSDSFYVQFSDANDLNRYLQSAYFCLVTMATVGYGDIRPQTEAETVFGILLVLVGCVMYGISAANVATIASNADITAEGFNQFYEQMTDFLNEESKSIPKELAEEVRAYYDELWLVARGVEETVTLDVISFPLRQEVCVYWYGKILQDCPILEGVRTDIIARLCILLDVLNFEPGNHIVTRDSVRHGMLFVSTGTVVKLNQEDLPLYLLEVGDYFGARNIRLMSPAFQSHTFISKTSATLLSWTYAARVELCDIYPEITATITAGLDEAILSEINKTKTWAWIRSHLLTDARMHKIRQRQREEEDRSWVISLHSPFRLFWAAIALSGIVFYALSVPVLVAWSNIWSGMLYVGVIGLSWLFDIFFLVDWYLSATRFVRVLGTEHHYNTTEQIRSHYFSWQNYKEILIDIVANAPCDALALVLGVSDRFTRAFLRFNRLVGAMRAGSYLDHINTWAKHSTTHKMGYQARKIIALWLLLFLAAHLLACWWYCLGHPEISFGWGLMDTDSNLVNSYNPLTQTNQTQPVSWFLNKNSMMTWTDQARDQYLLSLYYIMTTASTTGFGDIVPTSRHEFVFVIFVIIVGDLIYASIIGNVSVLAAHQNNKYAKHERALAVVNHYTHNRQLPITVHQQITTYMEYRHSNKTVLDSFDMVNQFPDQFRVKILNSIFPNICTLLSFVLSDIDLDVDLFVRQMVSSMMPRLIIVDEIFIRAGDPSSELYFIQTGLCQRVDEPGFRVHPSRQKQFVNGPPMIRSGEFVGDIGFILNNVRTCSVKARTTLQLLAINRYDWDRLLLAFDVDNSNSIFPTFREYWQSRWKYYAPSSHLRKSRFERDELAQARLEAKKYHIVKLWLAHVGPSSNDKNRRASVQEERKRRRSSITEGDVPAGGGLDFLTNPGGGKSKGGGDGGGGLAFLTNPGGSASSNATGRKSGGGLDFLTNPGGTSSSTTRQ